MINYESCRQCCLYSVYSVSHDLSAGPSRIASKSHRNQYQLALVVHELVGKYSSFLPAFRLRYLLPSRQTLFRFRVYGRKPHQGGVSVLIYLNTLVCHAQHRLVLKLSHNGATRRQNGSRDGTAFAPFILLASMFPCVTISPMRTYS